MLSTIEKQVSNKHSDKMSRYKLKLKLQNKETLDDLKS